MYLPKCEWGLGMPNVRVYNMSCLLRYAMNWLSDSSKYSNNCLESGNLGKWTLINLLHSNLYHLPPTMRTHSLYQDTMGTWRQLRRKLGQPLQVSAFLDIHTDPNFPQSREYAMFDLWRRKGILKYTQFFNMNRGKLKTFQELAQEYDIPESHFLAYLKVTTHMKQIIKDMKQAFKCSVVDGCVSKGAYPTRDIYPSLNKLFHNRKLSQPGNKWQKDVQGADIQDKLLTGYHKITKLAINKTSKETQYKILHRAYIPFLNLPHQPEASPCPKFRTRKPTLLHMLWSCPMIDTFWDQVFDYVKLITKTLIPKDEIFLLFHYDKTQKNPRSRVIPSWAHLSFLLDKRIIMKEWLTRDKPQLS